MPVIGVGNWRYFLSCWSVMGLPCWFHRAEGEFRQAPLTPDVTGVIRVHMLHLPAHVQGKAKGIRARGAHVRAMRSTLTSPANPLCGEDERGV